MPASLLCSCLYPQFPAFECNFWSREWIRRTTLRTSDRLVCVVRHLQFLCNRRQRERKLLQKQHLWAWRWWSLWDSWHLNEMTNLMCIPRSPWSVIWQHRESESCPTYAALKELRDLKKNLLNLFLHHKHTCLTTIRWPSLHLSSWHYTDCPN